LLQCANVCLVGEPLEQASEVLPLRSLVKGLPPPPPASLDPYLDAAARCFARHGIRRTSPQDVASELKVNRTTVYRQVGNVESMLRLLSARELHRLLGEVYKAIGGMLGPETLVDVLVHVVELVRAHPVVAKVLADERELIGLGMDDIPEMLGRIAAALVPPLEAAMDAGIIARRDPVVVAEWLARVGGSAVIAPPPGDLADFLRVFIVPVLQPSPEPAA
jgi:AcrR family transcriptional regulator